MVDGVLRRMRQGILYILERQVEIAPAMNARRRTDGCLQLRNLLADQFRIERKFSVGMRRGHDVCGTRIGRQAQHGHGILEGARAVVEAGQNMAWISTKPDATTRPWNRE